MEEEIIQKYRLGPDSRVKFKGDPQQYWIKNISADRKNVFVTINTAQTYRKLIKNIIQVDNNKIKEMKDNIFQGNRGMIKEELKPIKIKGTNYTAWYIKGTNDKSLFHREDGPAIEWNNGSKEWWINGKRHREDGPAVEWSNGAKHWYLNGQYLTKSQWEQKMSKKNISTTHGDLNIKYSLKENIKKILKELNIRPSPSSLIPQPKTINQKAIEIVKDQLFELLNTKEPMNNIEFFAENIVGLILDGDLNESKFDGDIKSSLEKIIQQVWSEKDLNKAKNIVTSYLNDSKIKDEDKKKMTQFIDKITTKGKLDYYLANSLLKYEGSGLSQLKAAELKESQKPKCQCQKH